MEKIKASNPSLINDNVKHVKTPYRSPIFQPYGTVSKLTSGSGGSLIDGHMNNQMSMSERQTKENIVRINTHWLGIGLYLFNYKQEYCARHGGDRKLGVMVDEVETVMPLAVSNHPGGYKTVNYTMLGITQAS